MTSSDGWFTPPPSFIAVSAGGLAALGGLLGAIPRQYRFRFEESQSSTVEAETHVTPKVPPNRLPPLQSQSLLNETPDQVCIKWNGKRIWLPKSSIKIEQDGDRIKLTVPAWMLGVE